MEQEIYSKTLEQLNQVDSAIQQQKHAYAQGYKNLFDAVAVKLLEASTENINIDDIINKSREFTDKVRQYSIDYIEVLKNDAYVQPELEKMYNKLTRDLEAMRNGGN